MGESQHSSCIGGQLQRNTHYYSYMPIYKFRKLVFNYTMYMYALYMYALYIYDPLWQVKQITFYSSVTTAPVY